MTLVQKNYFNPAAQGQRGWTYVRLCSAVSAWAWVKITRRIRAEKLANDYANAITGTPSGWHIFKCSGVAHFEVTDDREEGRFPGKNGAGGILRWLTQIVTATEPRPRTSCRISIGWSAEHKARNHSLKVAQFEVTGGGGYLALV